MAGSAYVRARKEARGGPRVARPCSQGSGKCWAGLEPVAEVRNRERQCDGSGCWPTKGSLGAAGKGVAARAIQAGLWLIVAQFL